MITVKEAVRMYGPMIMTMCGVIMCSLFLGYYFELSNSPIPDSESARSIYDSQLQMCLITSLVPTSMFLLFAVLATIFSLSDYISKNRSNMGVLKAMGYSEMRIALNFFKVAIPVAIGAAVGIIIASIAGPGFYSSMSGDGFTSPSYAVRPVLTICLIAVPCALFSVLSVLYAYFVVRKPALNLIKGSDNIKQSERIRKINIKNSGSDFSKLMKKVMLRSHLLVPIFIFIASWGFSSTIQMSFTMVGVIDGFGSILCGSIGAVLGIVMLILAEHSVMKKNSKNVTIMKAFGYSDEECFSSLLSSCRIIAVIGFLVGIPHQYYQLKFMVSLYDTVLEVNFSWIGLIVTAIAFIAIYEIMMYVAKRKIQRTPIKQTMSSD